MLYPLIAAQKFGALAPTDWLPKVLFGLPSGTASTYSATESRLMLIELVIMRPKIVGTLGSVIVVRTWRGLPATVDTTTVIPFVPCVNPLRPAASRAALVAVVKSSGIHTTAASAAASAAFCTSAARL